jgi:hypothetical protein
MTRKELVEIAAFASIAKIEKEGFVAAKREHSAVCCERAWVLKKGVQRNTFWIA